MSNIAILSEEKLKLLGIYIDNRLSFDYHITQLYKNAGEEMYAPT